MSIQFNRRHLLAAAPVAGIAVVVGAGPIDAMTETPVAALFREWKAAREFEDECYRIYDEETAQDIGWKVRVEVEDRLMTATCETMADWALKIIAYTDFGVGTSQDREDNPQLWAEARALVSA